MNADRRRWRAGGLTLKTIWDREFEYPICVDPRYLRTNYDVSSEDSNGTQDSGVRPTSYGVPPWGEEAMAASDQPM